MAYRIVEAERRFIDIIIGIIGCERPDAARILNHYRKLRIANLDPVGGSISVKHGAFLDADTLKNALEAARVTDTSVTDY